MWIPWLKSASIYEGKKWKFCDKHTFLGVLKSPRDLIFAACFSHINEQVATFLSIRKAFTRP